MPIDQLVSMEVHLRGDRRRKSRPLRKDGPDRQCGHRAGRIWICERRRTLAVLWRYQGVTLSKTPEPVPGGLAGLVNCKEIMNVLIRISCKATLESGATGVNATLELAKPAKNSDQPKPSGLRRRARAKASRKGAPRKSLLGQHLLHRVKCVASCLEPNERRDDSAIGYGLDPRCFRGSSFPRRRRNRRICRDQAR